MINSKLGERIRRARLEKYPHTTVKAVAKAIGISQSGLSHIENQGGHPQYGTCTKIAEVLDIDERELLILAGHTAEEIETPEVMTGKPDEEEQDKESESSRVTDDRALVSFLYELMRYYVTPGKVEYLVVNSEHNSNSVTEFSNAGLAKYAQELADRLTK